MQCQGFSVGNITEIISNMEDVRYDHVRSQLNI